MTRPLFSRPTRAPRHPVLRSWPWTIALAAVLTGFVLLGLFGVSRRTTLFELGLSLLVVIVALAALFRVLTSGVHVLPSGLMVRELTRTTPVPWARVRSIETAPTARKGVHAPVLLVALPPGKGQRGTVNERMELTLLASYREGVAKRRTTELLAARKAATTKAAPR